jgi:hypothetical protein
VIELGDSALLADPELAAREMIDRIAESDPGSAAVGWGLLAVHDALLKIGDALTREK